MLNRRSVLFDLDGTLLDTAPDMAYTLNQLRTQHHLPELPLAEIRPSVSLGARALLTLGFGIEKHDEKMPALLEEFLNLYAKHATNATRLFPGIDTVLEYLDDQQIPWGIVTNKASRFTFEILKTLDLECRTNCVVCGDTLPTRKPDPEPVLHACFLLNQEASDCVFIGDSIVDIAAGKAAGTQSLVALYGYIGPKDDPFGWQADGYIRDPIDIIAWLKAHPPI